MCPPGFSEAWLTWVSQQILNMRLFYHVLSIGLYRMIETTNQDMMMIDAPTRILGLGGAVKQASWAC